MSARKADMKEEVTKASVVVSKRPDGSVRVQLNTGTEGCTVQQQHKDAVNANRIVEKFEKSGLLPPIRSGGVYADVSQIGDYQASLEQVARAHEAFEGLPAKVRDRFENDPGQMLAFVSDSANRDEAIKLGLIEIPSPADPVSAPGAAEPAAQAPKA